MNKNTLKWKPFEYICHGFNGQIEKTGGFFPADVRHQVNFVIKKIEGPIIKGPFSYFMHQFVELGNK